MTLAANAQTQLANNGFEEWETVTYNGKSGEEPVKWSSFLDGTGKQQGLAAAVQLEKSTDVRPGSDGRYSARIKTRVISIPFIGSIPAQGNLTTGCVNMGSTTATDAGGNYNYINHEREDQAMKFTGRPLSCKFWLKGKCSQDANVTIHLVSNGYYQDPVYQDRNTAVEIANAVFHGTITETWTEYSVTFNYLSTNNPEYVLVNISTSAVPGKGAESDYLLVDDIEMVYNTTSLDAIETVTATDAAAYNLAGQRVTNNARGIVIKNGKKFIK